MVTSVSASMTDSHEMAIPRDRTVADWPAWACPHDASALREDFGALACSGGHRFQIVGGIPRFVPASSYADHFGEQWKRYRLTQLDSHTGYPISRDRLRRIFGEALWSRLHGSNVLECGCGAGRFTEVLLNRGARVTSIDLSNAVEANVENFPLSPMHRVAQADILTLPFAPRQFDVVACIGVIQHTPNPELTIERLYQHVRPGGWLLIDHYTYELGWYTKTAPLFRMVLKRLPAGVSMRLTERLVNAVLPIHKRVARSRVRSLLYRLSPVLTHYSTYPELDDELQRQWALLDTHDSLTDYFKHFRTSGQIKAQLERLGLDQTWCAYGGNGVEARARRPAMA
jgi:2-polyprenyl-3-methyl-5-hydroxy-6-metoxy-1,4-benzoquinol methylase